MKIRGGLVLVLTVAFSATGSPVAADDLKDELVDLEKAAWQAWQEKDGESYRDLVTDDAVLIDATGAITEGRDAIVAFVSDHDCQITNLSLSGFKVKQLTADTAIVSYRTTQDTTCEGQKLPSPVYSESIYVREDGKWRGVSYQETPLAE